MWRSTPVAVRAELSIRVIGASESGDNSGPGSVQSLSLDELLQSCYCDEYCNELQPLWIQVENASGAQLDRIGAHFGLHPLTVEAVQTRHTREKLEIFQNYLFLVFHALHEGMKAPREYNPAAAAAAQSRRTPVAPYAAGAPTDLPSVEEEVGRAVPASPHHKPSHVHEGSSLLPKHNTTKYYGPCTNRRHQASTLPTRHAGNGALLIASTCAPVFLVFVCCARIAQARTIRPLRVTASTVWAQCSRRHSRLADTNPRCLCRPAAIRACRLRNRLVTALADSRAQRRRRPLRLRTPPQQPA